ncbi:hypothetical protein Ahy_A10g050308 [Arachis hypogaea]|uniref:Aminotransferase-like plant mobile domain-containing protein n=1 Tax=Arachis hypogaea TaxID=3818 RepID=A0A445B922_ARAHY|nr:hypothetical protein Ahy_A10g050308 [Arachis hypogaea]
MAHQAGNDRDINKVNETTHYTEAADFERPRLLLPQRVSHTLPPPDAIVPYQAEAEFGDTVPLRDFTFDNALFSALVVPYGDVGVGGAAARHQTSRGSTAGGAEEGVFHAEAWVTAGSCPPDASDRQSRDPLTGVFLGLGCASLDVSVTLFGGTAGCHRYCWMHSAMISWIYQRFSQWCPPDRGVYQLVRLPQQSRDQHETRVLRWRVSIDRLRFDEFAWRVYDDSAMQTLCPPWFREEEEWGTWLSAAPLLCFNIVRFYHVDRVKQQFNGEQQVPGTPVNLDRYLTTTGCGEDV